MKNLLTTICLTLGLMISSSSMVLAVQADKPVATESDAPATTQLTDKSKVTAADHAAPHDVAHAGDEEPSHGHGGHHLGEPHEEMPVLPKTWRTDMSIYSLAVFLVLLALLTKFVWGPIIQGLDAREQSIKDDIAAAEKARLDAERMLADYQKRLESVQDEVRSIIAEARRDADHTKNDIIATAQKEAQATQKRATEEIERARDQALNELFNTMSNQVVNTTEQLLKRTIDSNDRQRLVQEALGEMNSGVFRN
jgi:F-type H+-transporting ATPase subunit b